MAALLQLFIWSALIGVFISLLLSRRNENLIAWVAIATTSVHLAGLVVFTGFWLTAHWPALDIKHIVLFKTGNIEIFIDLYFDKITLVYGLMGDILVLLVVIFSRYYLHRDAGYKRFFSTLLFFFLGYNLIIFSGNFETLFIGWEILGACSFLLIAFYRDRYLPVRNGLKVISIYRLGDICLILAMWMSHHLWHENITFQKINDPQIMNEHLLANGGYAVFVAMMIVIAALAKSGQLPFSSWVPRAMEGPTTSTAIFYGSLSVHLGVFLLLRTYPYWEHQPFIKVFILISGALTSIVATSISMVQSSVKAQIAYSSVAQIGLIFIEVALGFHTLALIHFAGNAFLRTYQLLVSPSVLSYLIHDMIFSHQPTKQRKGSPLFQKLGNSFYQLSVKEWNMDFFMYRFLWTPFKWIGAKFSFLTSRTAVVVLIALYLCGLYIYFFVATTSPFLDEFLPLFFSIGGLILILKAFTETRDASRAWIFVLAGQLFITLSIALLNTNFVSEHILIYLSGSVMAFIAGLVCLEKIKSIDNNINLNQFHGYTYEQPGTGMIFLIACLCFAGLPLTPTFIGIDLLFSHIGKHEGALIFLTALSFLFIELSILRIYCRVFLGQHKKMYHPVAYRSS